MIEVPTFTDAPVYTLETELGEVSYTLRFYWSPRAAVWLMDIRELDGTAVALARPCVCGHLLTLGIGTPAGQLVIIGDRDPQRYDWGTRCKLVYVGEDELNG